MLFSFMLAKVLINFKIQNRFPIFFKEKRF